MFFNWVTWMFRALSRVEKGLYGTDTYNEVQGSQGYIIGVESEGLLILATCLTWLLMGEWPIWASFVQSSRMHSYTPCIQG